MRLILDKYPVIVRVSRPDQRPMSRLQLFVFQRIAPQELVQIPAPQWERFAAGGAPLLAAKRKVDLLLLTLRDGVCEEADAFTLDLDENGYRLRIDLRMGPLPKHPGILDARTAFMRRYLRHAHHWRPSEQLLQSALHQISAARNGELAPT